MKKLSIGQNRFLIIVSFLIVVASTSNSCTKKSDMPGANEVFIEGNAFSPGTITVTANTTVTWTNKDGVAHTVTSNTGIFDSGTINANGTYSHLFATAGSYPYFCSVHPSMKGTVVVQ